MAIVLWKTYGGSIYLPELGTVALGHLLNAGLTIALAAATASMTEHPSTAAILTLSVTVGTWILNFVAAVEGGIWERIARYTPTAMVAELQHGLIRLDVVMAALTLIATGLAVAAVWMRLGVPVRRRAVESVATVAAAALVVFVCTFAPVSWDTSESRMSSFTRADEAALAGIRLPLTIEAHLAPEDPRRSDLEQRALAKLRRAMPAVRVRYVSATSIGLFEQTNEHYGEIWYDLGGRKAMSRVTTADGVLETIYSLSGISPPGEDEDSMFRGHPLAMAPTGAPVAFYLMWPGLVIIVALALGRAGITKG
jgi:hypothetical protein